MAKDILEHLDEVRARQAAEKAKSAKPQPHSSKLAIQTSQAEFLMEVGAQLAIKPDHSDAMVGMVEIVLRCDGAAEKSLTDTLVSLRRAVMQVANDQPEHMICERKIYVGRRYHA